MSAKDFEDKLRDTVQRAIELGYNPTQFTQMLDAHGGVGTARRLVASGDIQSGLEKLIKLGYPELSMEAIMLEPQFAGDFTKGELEAAQRRLDQANKAKD